jgi:N-terminal domain of galactosyltransferase/N-terminal region of glycosyl transferase group 7
MVLPKLSIIVPYRDRAEHLQRFMPHLVTYFQRDKVDKDIPVDVTIVEQAPGKPFNRGSLLNIGVVLKPEADYYCFHDVDYLPIWADYRFPDAPTRIIWYGANIKPIAPGSSETIPERYETFFGGVILMTREHIRRVNGYPNGYWGWGWEDAELRARCIAEDLPVRYRDGTFEALPHVNQGFAAGLKPTVANEKNHEVLKARVDQMSAGEAPHKADGLSTVKFEIVERLRPRDQHGNEAANIEKVTVEILGGP